MTFIQKFEWSFIKVIAWIKDLKSAIQMTKNTLLMKPWYELQIIESIIQVTDCVTDDLNNGLVSLLFE